MEGIFGYLAEKFQFKNWKTITMKPDKNLLNLLFVFQEACLMWCQMKFDILHSWKIVQFNCHVYIGLRGRRAAKTVYGLDLLSV